MFWVCLIILLIGETLETLITQLELRYKTWNANISVLNNYISKLNSNLSDNQNEVNVLKEKIALDYKNFDSEASIENVSSYVDLKRDYSNSRIVAAYCGNFMRQYVFLNSYNKRILDTLINNKEALINEWKVVIPDSWSQLTRELELLYDEEEWKSEQSKLEEEE